MRARMRVFGPILSAGVLAAPMAAGADDTGLPTIVNGTNYAIVSCQARPAGSGHWQTDLLVHKTLGVAKSTAVNLSRKESCLYDLFVTFDDGHKVLRQNVNICQGIAILITDTP